MNNRDLLSCRGVSLSYDALTPVLRGVDFSVPRGGYAAIVGPSGSGKSTMLNVLGLLDRPDVGTYTFDGVDTTLLSDKQRSGLRGSKIGFVFQAYHLMAHRSTDDNVAVAELYTRCDRRGRERRAEAALERVGLGHKIGVAASKLSGGERQRVAIARALIGEPDLLLCDEPTGNLDSVNTAQILDVFDEIHQSGITIVSITHDMLVAQRAQTQWTMTDGRLHQLAVLV